MLKKEGVWVDNTSCQVTDLRFFVAVSFSDYDAPLSEAGDVTKKYKLLRDVFAKYNADVKGKSQINYLTLNQLVLTSLIFLLHTTFWY